MTRPPLPTSCHIKSLHISKHSRFPNGVVLNQPGEAIKLKEEESDTSAVYVEKRLPIDFSAKRYTELHQRLIDHLDRVEQAIFRNNFKMLISQIAEFIWELGYDDVTNENGPLFNVIDGKEVYFTNFDDVLKDLSFSRTQAQIGIEFFFEMLPHEITKETMLPIISRFNEEEKKVLLESMAAILKDSNLDLLDRSSYRPGVFPF